MMSEAEIWRNDIARSEYSIESRNGSKRSAPLPRTAEWVATVSGFLTVGFSFGFPQRANDHGVLRGGPEKCPQSERR